MALQQSIPVHTLHDGYGIPAIGFGTYTLKGNNGVETMLGAIEQGYRMLDTAFNYENEGAVGQAVQRSGIEREEFIITSKLPGRHHAYDAALETIEESLFRAQLSYYDLYLIHWPNPKQGLFVEAWQALIEAQKRGQIKSIGVSNFLPEHIELLKQETGVVPVVNQLELHPFFNQQENREYNQRNGIVTMAWSPLGRASDILHHPILEKIAADVGKTVPQIILRWQFQLGVITIPKATSTKNQVENKSIFDFGLTDEQMTEINTLSKSTGRLQDQDPAIYEEF
ncbi:aldo/keto reductase [Acinetobacter nectaris]|uniref:aldo/keto reductase n=1 Tax=Acinetobacter nectaris TaxID=1219382 RepID=UPI001F383C04|nr:aldo/keto reductase [Acinetobacter nectaris]MCF8999553.1 aldo/keto reductase [Acinetobacter nectaris]MCF9027209.1 aldo/keto reductase [Acinetobacter nectaris]